MRPDQPLSLISQVVNVISPRTWRVADTMLRYKMVLAGAGWTHFARAWVAADIEAGRLVELRSEKNAPPPSYAMRAFYRISAPPGPAGQWLLERLCDAAGSPSRPTSAPRKPRRRGVSASSSRRSGGA